MIPRRLVELERFEVAGRSFVFAVPSSALFEIPGDVADALDVGPLDPVEAVQRLPSAAADELAELGLLHPTDEPPTRLRDPSPTDDSVATLVLHLTRLCNLDCAYCYTRPARGRSTPVRMDEGVVRAAVDFLFEHLPARGPAGLTLFGGEPLLEPSALTIAVRRARERAASSGRGVLFSLTTNGTRVTPGVVELLASIDARVTVSLDGDADRHDLHRRRPDGRGSHGDAVRGLSALLDRCDVTARATLAGPRPDPVGVFEELLELGVPRAGIATADVDPDSPLAHGEDGLGRLWEGMDELARRYRDEALAGRHLGFTNMDGLLRTIHRGANRDHPCGAGLRLLACDTDGTLYLCHRLTGEPGYAVGSLSAGLSAPRRREIVARNALSSRPACRRCWARHLCGGGCHHAHHLAGGGAPGRPLAVCPWLRRWLRRGLEVYAELSVRRPGFLQEFVDPLPACPVE